MNGAELVDCLEWLMWSNRQLALAANCSEATVRRWVRGEYPVPPAVARPLRRMAKCHRDNPLPDLRAG